MMNLRTLRRWNTPDIDALIILSVKLGPRLQALGKTNVRYKT